MDFLSFGIAGPVTATADGLGESKILNGQASAMGKEVYWNTRCLADTFTVAGATRGGSPPVICGENTGQHGENVLRSIYFSALLYIFEFQSMSL